MCVFDTHTSKTTPRRTTRGSYNLYSNFVKSVANDEGRSNFFGTSRGPSLFAPSYARRTSRDGPSKNNNVKSARRRDTPAGSWVQSARQRRAKLISGKELRSTSYAPHPRIFVGRHLVFYPVKRCRPILTKVKTDLTSTKSNSPNSLTRPFTRRSDRS